MDKKLALNITEAEARSVLINYCATFNHDTKWQVMARVKKSGKFWMTCYDINHSEMASIQFREINGRITDNSNATATIEYRERLTWFYYLFVFATGYFLLQIFWRLAFKEEINAADYTVEVHLLRIFAGHYS